MSIVNQNSIFKPAAPDKNMFPQPLYLNVDFKINLKS